MEGNKEKIIGDKFCRKCGSINKNKYLQLEGFDPETGAIILERICVERGCPRACELRGHNPEKIPGFYELDGKCKICGEHLCWSPSLQKYYHEPYEGRDNPFFKNDE